MIDQIENIIQHYESDTFSGVDIPRHKIEAMAECVWVELKQKMKYGGSVTFDGQYYQNVLDGIFNKKE